MPLYNPVQNFLTLLASRMSGSTPTSESTSGSPGSTMLIPDAGHSHPRLTSADIATIASGSTVKIAFTRTFTKPPAMFYTLIESDTGASQQPCLFATVDYLAADGVTSLGTASPADGVVIGGCVVKAWRANIIPQNLATLLLTAAWSLFGGSVVGVKIAYVALASSRP